jgi:hypothetical protein
VGSNPTRGTDVCPRLFCCQCCSGLVARLIPLEGVLLTVYKVQIEELILNGWLVGWNRPAKDKAHFWALANTVMNLLGPGGSF